MVWGGATVTVVLWAARVCTPGRYRVADAGPHTPMDGWSIATVLMRATTHKVHGRGEGKGTGGEGRGGKVMCRSLGWGIGWFLGGQGAEAGARISVRFQHCNKKKRASTVSDSDAEYFGYFGP